MHDDLPTLLLLLALTVVGPIVAVRARLPSAVVLILVGIAVGPAGFAWARVSPTVSFVSELGFLILMFGAGMEIDFASLRRVGVRALAMPSLVVVGCFGLAAGVGFAIGLRTVEVLIVAAMSLGMPLAVLQETGTARTAVGRHVLLTASVGEFVTILGITALEVFTRDGSVLERALRLGKVVVLFVGCALLIRWARAFVWWRPGPFKRLVQNHDVAEMGVRVGLLIMLGFVALASLFGVEAILGAFIAGALVSFVIHEKKALEDKIGALGQGLFVPIFFLIVGVRFDPRLLDLGSVRDAAVLVGLAGAVKILPALLFAEPEMSLRERLASGCLLAAPLTLVVGVAVIGRQLGLMTDRQEASAVLVAVVLSVVFPTLFRRVLGATPAKADAAAPA